MLLMLEDDADRITRFCNALTTLEIPITLMVWRDAYLMMNEAREFLPECG